MTEQKRAAIYARSATFPDHGAAFPIAQQIHLCHEYAIREGYEVVEEFQEVGSGMVIGPVLKSVLDRAGIFDVLIIRSFDRLSRNPSLTTEVIETLEENGVKVLSVTQEVLPIDIDKELEKLSRAICEEVARIERERISARSKSGRHAKE